MKLEALLNAKGIGWADVTAAVRDRVNLREGDMLFAYGSLVEGIGNAESDIDFYLVTPRADISFTSLTDISFELSGLGIDIRTLPSQEVEHLVARLERWFAGTREARAAFAFTEDERRFLHGVAIGRPTFDEAGFHRLRTRVSSDGKLRRHKLDWSCHLAACLAQDLSGVRGDEDHASAWVWGQELLWLGVDMLLAGAGRTNPNKKWRARLAVAENEHWRRRLPGIVGNDPVAAIIGLHRGPSDLRPAEILRHTLQIAAFSRAAMATAQRNILAGRGLPLLPLLDTDPAPVRRLPALDYLVMAEADPDGFVVYRLGDPESERRLTEIEFVLICLFDGATSYTAAKRYADALSPGASAILRELLHATRDLWAPPVIEDGAASAFLAAGGDTIAAGEAHNAPQSRNLSGFASE